MSQKFKQGLVVGKFSPLHRGHELLIHRAIEECENVAIISYSQPELTGCEANKREQWLAGLFPETVRLVVTNERLQDWAKSHDAPRKVPANDAQEIIHRRFCGYLCHKVLKMKVDAVFTSESYGDGFAKELSSYFREQEPMANEVQHVMVDQARRQIPISGTILRNAIHQNRQWLSPLVYASFVHRICLLGGESSGKSLLAEEAAKHFSTVHTVEYGRELWEARNGRLTFEDMQHIAEVQISREEKLAQKANEFLFCDTSPLTTLFYSEHLFGKADDKLQQMANRNYDHIILCAPDFPFVQDGTRKNAVFREGQHKWYLQRLEQRRIPFLTANGPISNRLLQIESLIRR